MADNLLHALLLEGYIAVSFFMVISGFIFTLACGGKVPAYGRFLFNRFLRTYPLMLLLLAVALLLHPDRFEWLGLFKTLFFMANLEGSINISPYTGLFWALALEWQFYLIFPLIMVGVLRWGMMWLLMLLVVILALRFSLYQPDFNMVNLTYSTILGRADQFLLGMLAALFYARGFVPGLRWDMVFGITLVVMLVLVWFANQNGWFWYNGPLRFLFPLIEAVVWAALLLGYLSISRRIPAYFANPLCQLGVVSYSVYLLHSIVIRQLGEAGWLVSFEGSTAAVQASLNTALLVFPIVCLLSTFSYRFIEKPFLQLRQRYVSN